MPRLSIVMPVYNARAFLPRTFSAFEAQTFRDFEVIVVDDGSSDGSGEWLDGQLPQFALRVIHQENQGAAVARNVAMALANTEYLMMVDADDILHPRTFEWAIAALEGAHADFVLFDYCIIHAEAADEVMHKWSTNNDNRPVAERIPTPIFDWFLDERRDPGLWQFVFRRETIAGKKFATGIMYEDNPFVYGYLSAARSGVRIKSQLYGYVQNQGSVMHATKVVRQLASIEAVLRALRQELTETQYGRLMRESYFRTLRGLYRETCKVSYSDDVRNFRNSAFRRLIDDSLIKRSDVSLWWYIRFVLAGRRG